MSFIDEVMVATEESESPRNYYWWSSLATIAATVKSQVWLDRFYYKLYPNLYIFLVGESGIRKGPPIALAKGLVELVGQRRVIAGRASIEAIVNELATATTTKHGGPPITDASGFVVSQEFAASIVRNPDALTILTDLFDSDYNQNWKNRLKSTGTEELQNLNLNVLGGLNETMFHDIITDKEVTGGFLARTLLVLEHERARLNSLTRPPAVLPDKNRLSTWLRSIKDIKGEFCWTDDSRDLYDEWYYRYNKTVKKDKSGVTNRIPDHVLKVAMNYSLSYKKELVLESHDIQTAMSKVLALEDNVKKVTEGQGKSVSSRPMQLIVMILLSVIDHKMTRTKLLQRGRGEYDYMEFDRAIDTLIQSDIVKQPYLSGREMVYELKPEFVMQYHTSNKEEEKKEDGKESA